MNSPTVTIRVQPGSELAKLIAAERATARSNVSKMMHELAARDEQRAKGALR